MRIEHEVQRGPVTVELLEGGVEIIDRLAPEWSELCGEGPCDEPFYKPSWLRAHVEAFETAPILLAVARTGGQLRAVLPLILERTLFSGAPTRMLRALCTPHSCRFDMIHGKGDAGDAARAIWARLRDETSFDLLRLAAVPDGGASFAILEAAQGEGHLTERELVLRTPYLPLPGTLEDLLGRTDAKFRSNLRRRGRKLEERGEVKLTRFTDFDAGALERFFELEKAGWKGEEGTAIACDPGTRRFYETVARAGAAEGWFTLYHLTAGGQDVAAHFGVTWKGRYFLPKPAYHEGFKECSPGQLMVQEVVRDCIGRGLTEFDFLGPMMDWKADWAPRERQHFYLYVYRKGVIGKMLHAAKFKLRRVDAERQGRGE